MNESNKGMNRRFYTLFNLLAKHGCTDIEENEMATRQSSANIIKKKARMSNASSSSSETLLSSDICVRLEFLEHEVAKLKRDKEVSDTLPVDCHCSQSQLDIR